MTFWRALCLCLGAAGAGQIGAADAQDVQNVPSPILTVDQEALFTGSHESERVAQEIDRRASELAAENRKIEADLVAEELALTKKRPTLEPAAFRALADAFDQKVQDFRAQQDAKTRELQRLREQARQDFLRRITPLLTDLVREKGAVVVLERRKVFLSADSIDITAEAIARINAALDAGPQPGPRDLPLGVPDPSPDTPPAPDDPVQP